MIRIEVQQESGGERIAWEFRGRWDVDAAGAILAYIDDQVQMCERLGVSLWDVMAAKAPTHDVDFQVMARPRSHRCLTFPVQPPEVTA